MPASLHVISDETAESTRKREDHRQPSAEGPIAGMPVQKLRSSDIDAYYATIPVGSRPVHHTVLRRALRKAAKERLIMVNPAADLDHAPRRRKAPDDARVNCWSPYEAKTFLAAAKAAGCIVDGHPRHGPPVLCSSSVPVLFAIPQTPEAPRMKEKSA